jgi:predicted metal-dependent enzyme (double-stranded beta helix superfamily)
MDERAGQRKREIEAAVADVRAIEAREGVTRQSLDNVKRRLVRLAGRSDLFTGADFPPPQPGSKRNSCLYRVSEDPDHRFALYVNSSLGNYGTPAHNHTTWAVIVGVAGDELNRYMYGLALEQLLHREYYKAEERAWKVFPPHSDIREARSSL